MKAPPGGRIATEAAATALALFIALALELEFGHILDHGGTPWLPTLWRWLFPVSLAAFVHVAWSAARLVYGGGAQLTGWSRIYLAALATAAIALALISLRWNLPALVLR